MLLLENAALGSKVHLNLYCHPILLENSQRLLQPQLVSRVHVYVDVSGLLM